jgi:hypothetical protein
MVLLHTGHDGRLQILAVHYTVFIGAFGLARLEEGDYLPKTGSRSSSAQDTRKSRRAARPIAMAFGDEGQKQAVIMALKQPLDWIRSSRLSRRIAARGIR